MKNQNLSFNEKTNILTKSKIEDVINSQMGKKKRSASPVTKSVKSAYNSKIVEEVMKGGKPKPRSGSRKTHMKSPNNAKVY